MRRRRMSERESQNGERSAVERLLRKKEVAAMLACSVRMVERLVASGKLTAVKIRGAVRFRVGDVERIIVKGVS
jgi:excisionase family DNA binding protein